MDKLHKTFMRIAYDFAEMSHCVSKKVACIAVRDGRIISTGINGTAPGFKNCDEIFVPGNFDRTKHHDFSDIYEIHAEMNCLLYAARNGITLEGASLYCTLSPCWNCLKNISVVGVNNIYYGELYDNYNTVDTLKKIDSYCKTLNINITNIKIA